MKKQQAKLFQRKVRPEKATLHAIKKKLKKCASKEKAARLSRFFKTGAGEYGEGDVFIGVMVPELRKIAKQSKDLTGDTHRKLIKSPIHEERLLALLILVSRTEDVQEESFNFYFQHIQYVNNWDLVDLSAPGLVGRYLLNKKKKRNVLYALARSGILWERRIEIPDRANA